VRQWHLTSGRRKARHAHQVEAAIEWACRAADEGGLSIHARAGDGEEKAIGAGGDTKQHVDTTVVVQLFVYAP
jgi:hypothetical protein